jgi:hypothetical protein
VEAFAVEGFIEGESERVVDLIERRSGVLQLPKDSTYIDVVQEGVVIISQIRVAPVVSKDVLNPAATTLAFCSHANDIAGRRCRGLRWRCCR